MPEYSPDFSIDLILQIYNYPLVVGNKHKLYAIYCEENRVKI